MRRLFFLLSLTLLTCFLSWSNAVATDVPDPPPSIIYVVPGGSGVSGDSWRNALGDLQAAIDWAAEGSDVQVWVKTGTYSPISGGTDREMHFSLKNGVTVYGGFAGIEPDTFDLASRNVIANKTILSGDIGTPDDASDNCYHVFYHPDTLALDDTAALDGFTITGGNADGDDPHDCGGGMYNSGSSPKITNCTFSANLAASGGGMDNCDNASPTLINCTFRANQAEYGGGMNNDSFSSPTLTNCTFSGNLATTGGGGMYNSESSPILTNCILWGDTATSGGAEVDNADATPTFSYCDIDGSYAGSSWDSNLGTDDGDNIDADPLFVRDPGTNGSDDLGDLHLAAASPCVNAGDNSAVAGIATDMDGEDRVYNGTTDMGTDEMVDANANGIPDYAEPGIVITEPSGNVSENRDTATFKITLNSQPDGDVVLTVVSDDLTEGHVSPAALTFTTGNWHLAQTVTVTGIDDAETDGNQTFNVLIDVDDDNTDDTTGYTDLNQHTVSLTNVDEDLFPRSGSSSGSTCFIGSLIGN